ncbi:hypothetical protein ACF3DV_05425 [Chlorogloeopsis fritschii PCC 9212]|nr:hypothetical protein [Chlorogloeopsis fritschii]
MANLIKSELQFLRQSAIGNDKGRGQKSEGRREDAGMRRLWETEKLEL